MLEVPLQRLLTDDKCRASQWCLPVDSVNEISVVLRVSRSLLVAGARVMVLGSTLMGTGCISFPVSSTSPVNETGLIDETTLESLIGLDQEEVSEKIGQPDYWGLRGDSYVLVYEGVETWSTDIYLGGIGPFFIPVFGKFDTDFTEVFHCYVIEMDEFHAVQGSEIIVRSSGGITSTEASYYTVDPIVDCAEAVWEPDERDEILAMNAAVAWEAQRKVDEEVMRKAAVAKEARRKADEEAMRMAKNGDGTAAYALYWQLSGERQTFAEAWRWLCLAANGGHGEAQRSVGNRHRTLTWQSEIERLGWLRDDVGIQQDNRVAYMWYTLADSSGDLSAIWMRASIESDMAPDEIAQAEQMARDWKPGDCPSVEHLLPASSSQKQASKARSGRKIYARAEGEAVAASLAALKIQHLQGVLSDEEYMQKQREIINEYTRKTRANLPDYVPPD